MVKRFRPRSWLSLWPLALILGLILFPFGWLGEVWPEFGLWLGMMFNSVKSHAIGHGLLFFGLGLAVLISFPSLQTRFWRYLSLTMLAAIGQELFQLAYKRRALVFDDWRDLAVDGVALCLAYGLGWLWRIRSLPHR